MSATLLATKLHIPQPRARHPRLALVTRDRLIARLDEGLERKLILICAPAGFGKTSLAVAWLQKHRGSGHWPAPAHPSAAGEAIPFDVGGVSLDAGDNDPMLFPGLSHRCRADLPARPGRRRRPASPPASA